MRLREPSPIQSVISLFLKMSGLGTGMNIHLICSAWDKVSGAGNYTLNKYYKSGTLYCSISSSMLRKKLYYRKAEIIREMNAILSEDEYFDKTNKYAGEIKNIVLK